MGFTAANKSNDGNNGLDLYCTLKGIVHPELIFHPVMTPHLGSDVIFLSTQPFSMEGKNSSQWIPATAAASKVTMTTGEKHNMSLYCLLSPKCPEDAAVPFDSKPC